MQNSMETNGKSNGKLESKDQEILTLNREYSSESPTNKPRIKQIDGLPTATVQRGEEDFVIIFGNHMINSKSYKSHEEAVKYMKKYPWIEILNVIGIYVNYTEESKTK